MRVCMKIVTKGLYKKKSKTIYFKGGKICKKMLIKNELCE